MEQTLLSPEVIAKDAALIALGLLGDVVSYVSDSPHDHQMHVSAAVPEDDFYLPIDEFSDKWVRPQVGVLIGSVIKESAVRQIAFGNLPVCVGAFTATQDGKLSIRTWRAHDIQNGNEDKVIVRFDIGYSFV